jgi:hypothetical protein
MCLEHLGSLHIHALLSGFQGLPTQHVHQLLDQMLRRDLQPLLNQPQNQLGNAGQQFVMSRALMLGAQLQVAASAQHKKHLLQAAATAGEVGCLSQPVRQAGCAPCLHQTPRLRLTA